MPDAAPGESNLGKLAQQPIVSQYLFFRKLHAHQRAFFVH